MPTAWWDKDDGIVGLGVDARTFKAFEGRVSASAVVTRLGDAGPVAMIGTERGRLMMLTSDGGVAELAELGGPIEAPALVADADGDSRYELFVASNDGFLTCFDTGSQLTSPKFRAFEVNHPTIAASSGA